MKDLYKTFLYQTIRSIIKDLDICTREILRLFKRHFDLETTQKDNFKENFIKVSAEKYGVIENYSNSNDSFINTKEMICKTIEDRSQIDNQYFLYQGLCELSHGKMLARLPSERENFGIIGMAYMSLLSLKNNLVEQTQNNIKVL